MRIGWQIREPPLPPCAAVGRGEAAERLVQRLLAGDDSSLERLSGVAGSGLVAVVGPREALPWVPGLCWLGRDPEAPALLLPTALGPTVPADWLQGAILGRCAPGEAPIAVLADPLTLIPLGAARPLVRARLQSVGR